MGRVMQKSCELIIWEVILITLPVILIALPVILTAQEVEKGNRVETVSKHGFDKTVELLTKSIKAKGMMIVGIIDHQKMLSMVGVKIKGSKTIEFGKPDMGKMVLTMNPEAGIEMPAKIYVYENKEGKTIISYYKPNYSQYNPEFSKVDEMMSMMLQEIVNEANK
jgi:uncharacterized protein (DUF302 family)